MTRPFPTSDAAAQFGGSPRVGLLQATRIIHPFPTLLNVAATAGLAVVAASGVPDGSLLARMLLTMLCAQSAIGVINDYADRELDAATKPGKPIVAGLVSPRAALTLGLTLIALTVGFSLTLGFGGCLLAIVGMSCGLAYDVRLKRTPLSALPFMIAIPTLPLWVWLTLGEWQPVLWWLLPLGALLGLSIHLTNTLPDIESDAANGIEGLAHALGRERSMQLAWGTFTAALAISLALAPFVTQDWRWYLAALVTGLMCLVGSIGAYALREDEWSLRLVFPVLATGSAVVAVGWLAAVT